VYELEGHAGGEGRSGCGCWTQERWCAAREKAKGQQARLRAGGVPMGSLLCMGFLPTGVSESIPPGVVHDWASSAHSSAPNPGPLRLVCVDLQPHRCQRHASPGHWRILVMKGSTNHRFSLETMHW
jgi:hypothetical protein